MYAATSYDDQIKKGKTCEACSKNCERYKMHAKFWPQNSERTHLKYTIMFEDNDSINLDHSMWNGFIWVRISCSGSLLLIWQKIFKFHKRRKICMLLK